MLHEEIIVLALKESKKQFDKLGLLNKTLVVIVGLSLAISLLVVALYAFTMSSGLSRSSSDWGNFGSLLSGLFAFTGTFAAVATLIAIQAQFKEQQAVTAKQIDSIEFDRYDKHRRIFFERLESIENLYENGIEFYNKEELYENVYPENSPSHCEINIALGDPYLAKANDITDIKEMFSSLESSLDAHSMDIDTIFKIIKLQSALHIENKKNPRNGDVIFFDINTGINIYSLNEMIFILSKAYNSILKFTGNFDQISVSYKAEGRLVRDRILHEIHAKSGIDHPFKVHRENDALLVYEEIYLLIEAERSKQARHYREESYRIVEKILNEEKTRSGYLNNIDRIRSFINIIQHETLEMDSDESDLNKRLFREFNQRLSDVVRVKMGL